MSVTLRSPAPMARPVRGGPLLMLALLLGGWSAARVWLWEDISAAPAGLAGLELAAAARPPPHRARPDAFADAAAAASAAAALAASGPVPVPLPVPVPDRVLVAGGRAGQAGFGRGVEGGRLPHIAGLPGVPAAPYAPAPAPATPLPSAAVPSAGLATATAPALPAPVAPAPSRPQGRWSLDSWAFWRQGSGAVPVSQGRVPIYGASQMGSVLHYRLAPPSGHDPRLQLRAYRALVPQGESELALGASLRPLPRVPLRLVGEARYTDAAFFSTFRPAAYAVTELPPLRLPLAATLEAYAQAGWVGGPGATPFADGQVSLTHELGLVGRLTDDRLRLSLGAGAWGGAQRDAERVDVGPTIRIDTRIGKVPARLSVDWRQQVTGDASPRSGVAATVSAGF